MSENSSKTYPDVVWTGKPWIFPSAIARTLLIVIISVLIFWLEFYFGLAYYGIAEMPLILWTAFALVLAWILSLSNLLLLKASNTYVLRSDSLEIKTGILSLKQFMIVPAGFSDLEVIQSVLGRTWGYGSIVIHSQSEVDVGRKIVRVRNPSRVAEQIRYVMARPIVRMEKPQ
jgi:membrane protein YdbS with pleckstrin-like domain